MRGEPVATALWRRRPRHETDGWTRGCASRPPVKMLHALAGDENSHPIGRSIGAVGGKRHGGGLVARSVNTPDRLRPVGVAKPTSRSGRPGHREPDEDEVFFGAVGATERSKSRALTRRRQTMLKPMKVGVQRNVVWECQSMSVALSIFDSCRRGNLLRRCPSIPRTARRIVLATLIRTRALNRSVHE